MGAGEIAAEVGSQVVGGRVAVGRVLRQQLHGDGVERLGHAHTAVDQGLRLLLDVLVGDRDRRVGLERRCPRQHLVEHHAERIQVAAAVDGLALGLLGREVGGGAHHRAVLGEARIGPAGERGGDTEVGDLHVAAVGHQDVAELDVAVDETGLMGGRERGGHVGRDLGGPVRLERPGGAQHVGHAAPRHVLHHDVVGPPLLTPVVDAHDVGVVEVGGGLRLSPEALHEVRIVGELGEQDLQRDLAIEELVTGEIDVGHPAAGDVAQQLVPAVEHGRALIGHGRRF